MIKLIFFLIIFQYAIFGFCDEEAFPPESSSESKEEISQSDRSSKTGKYIDPAESLTYDPYRAAWTYGSSDASPQYNPFSGGWEEIGSEEELIYNPLQDTWSPGSSDADLQYNPLSEEWEYTE